MAPAVKETEVLHDYARTFIRIPKTAAQREPIKTQIQLRTLETTFDELICTCPSEGWDPVLFASTNTTSTCPIPNQTSLIRVVLKPVVRDK